MINADQFQKMGFVDRLQISAGRMVIWFSLRHFLVRVMVAKRSCALLAEMEGSFAALVRQ